jgi:hypothetical protein
MTTTTYSVIWGVKTTILLTKEKFMITYKEYVLPYINNFVAIRIDDEEVKIASNFAYALANAKTIEHSFNRDNHNEYKRQLTGILGEIAIEKIIGIPIVDWEIGLSKEYNTPDIPGFNIGIKTVEYSKSQDKFPIIFKRNKYPQIINLKMSDNIICICGLATVDVLNEYQDDSLILSPSLRVKGTKTGFYGLHKLIKLDTETLMRYKKRSK